MAGGSQRRRRGGGISSNGLSASTLEGKHADIGRAPNYPLRPYIMIAGGSGEGKQEQTQQSILPPKKTSSKQKSRMTMGSSLLSLPPEFYDQYAYLFEGDQSVPKTVRKNRS